MFSVPNGSSVIPEEFRSAAEVVLSDARRKLELDGKLKPAVFFCAENDFVEIPISDEIAERCFKTGEGREHFFRTIRAAAEMGRASAVILVNDVYLGVANEKFMALAAAERERLMKLGIPKLAKDGWVERSEAVIVTCQNSRIAVHIEQAYERERSKIAWGPRRVVCFDQRNYHDRMKMFDADNAEEGAAWNATRTNP